MGNIKYTKELLESVVVDSVSFSDVCRKLGKFPKGAMWSLVKSKIEKFNIDTSHFLGQSAQSGERQVGKCKKLTADEILVCDKPQRERASKLRRALLETGVPYECEKCKINKWLGVDLLLEVDHKNGDWSDCRKDNLRFMCPNCHSQATYNKRSVS